MTLRNANTIKTALRCKGNLEGMTFERIYKYESVSGEKLFALFTEAQFDDMMGNRYVKNPVLLMDNGELTDEGKTFLQT